MGYLSEAKKRCADYGIKPIKRKGQNFLIEKDVYDKIVEAGELDFGDMVLEVGPGLGFLTLELAERVKKVVAVELDDKLAEILEKRAREANYDNIKLVNKNILNLEPQRDVLEKKEERGYKIMANLPYNITSIFLRKFLSEGQRPRSMVLMLQKEVAFRILSSPPESVLSVMVKFYAEPKMICLVGKENFWPQPKVDSAVIKLDIKEDLPNIDEGKFFELVKVGYRFRRKMLKNNLASGFNISTETVIEKLKIVEIPVAARPQELNVDDWIKLLKEFG